MRAVEKERDELKYEYLQIKNASDKLKVSKNKEMAEINVKYSHKANDYELVKAEMQKYKKELTAKEEQFRIQVQKQKDREVSYK